MLSVQEGDITMGNTEQKLWAGSKARTERPLVDFTDPLEINKTAVCVITIIGAGISFSNNPNLPIY